MQHEMECDWFKPSNHEVILFPMIQKHSTSKFATKLKFIIKKVATKIILFSTLATKCEKCTIECIQNEKMSQNTGINKLNWRINYV